MASDPSSDNAGQPARKPAQGREDRLKALLKANMAKRKAQARARKGAGVSEKAEKTGE
ncbi:MAG: hypothetical protein ABJL99_20000 [Aliishimia sp.]